MYVIYIAYIAAAYIILYNYILHIETQFWNRVWRGTFEYIY